MIIIQKNFNEPRTEFVTAPKPGEGYGIKHNLPWVTQATPTPAPKPQTPTEEDLVQSALRKKNSYSYFERNSLSPQEQAALDKYTEKLRTDSAEQALNKIKEEASKPVNTPTAPTIQEDVPIITEASEEEVTPELNAFQEDRKREAAELRANTGLVRGKAQGYLDSAREKANNLKEKASNTLGKLSENYGELTDGRSLGKDAAIAAGGLALAGGAYHLIKKRRAKKKAEKEALEARIKK